MINTANTLVQNNKNLRKTQSLETNIQNILQKTNPDIANRLSDAEDCIFTLTEKEYENLKSKNATSSWGERRKLPDAFTETGNFTDS